MYACSMECSLISVGFFFAAVAEMSIKCLLKGKEFRIRNCQVIYSTALQPWIFI